MLVFTPPYPDLISGRDKWSPWDIPPHTIVGKPTPPRSMKLYPMLHTPSPQPFCHISLLGSPPTYAYGLNVYELAVVSICFPPTKTYHLTDTMEGWGPLYWG